MAIIESKLAKNETFDKNAAHWRAEVERLRGEEAKIRLGGGENQRLGVGQGRGPGRVLDLDVDHVPRPAGGFLAASAS